jgi:hypothetical protein
LYPAFHEALPVREFLSGGTVKLTNGFLLGAVLVS